MIRKIKIIITLAVILSGYNLLSQEVDSLRINYNYLNSIPQNAEVYVNDELMGNTPLFFQWKDSTTPKTITVKLKGYSDYTEHMPGNQLINTTFKLIPLKGTGLINPVKEDKATYFNKPRKVVPIVLSSIVAAGAGFSAFYFKSLAIDNRDYYDQYGDPAALDKKKKYDIISGVSLALFQVGLGALFYFLFIDN